MATSHYVSELPMSRHVSSDDPRFNTFLWPASAQCALVDGLENLLDACHPHFAHAGLVAHKCDRLLARPMLGVNPGIDH